VPKNEDGEFELVLANRQLLSVFFIVVILLGVFFTMGYIVGRSPSQVDVAAHKAESKPIVVDSPAPQETPAPAAGPPVETPAPAATQQQQPPAEEAKVEPKPEQPAPVKKETPAKKEKQAKEKPAPVAAQPTSGQTYLQISATQKAEADVMVDVLHQKKFKAIAVQIPDKPGLYRVLVGPLADGTLNQTKSDLQSSGFPGDKAIKKVF
jgi:outer membrane biosynthesis protein TonB